MVYIIRKLRVILLTAVYPDRERPMVEGEGSTKRLEQVTSARPDEAEATTVSTRRDMVKESLERKEC